MGWDFDNHNPSCLAFRQNIDWWDVTTSLQPNSGCNDKQDSVGVAILGIWAKGKLNIANRRVSLVPRLEIANESSYHANLDGRLILSNLHTYTLLLSRRLLFR